MLKICCWLWGSKYDQSYVRKWRDGIRRHLKQPHEILVIRPDPADLPLTEVRGCFVRLRMFDPSWQREIGLKPDERLVCTDLDVIFTGALDPLFDRDYSTFTILGGANAANPCPFNGSVMMLRAGHHREVWRDFSIKASARAPYYEFPDDQGWLWHKLPDAATWHVGKTSGIYAFQKPGWPGDDKLPDDAKIVVFPGWRDPSKFTKLGWVQEHWI